MLQRVWRGGRPINLLALPIDSLKLAADPPAKALSQMENGSCGRVKW